MKLLSAALALLAALLAPAFAQDFPVTVGHIYGAILVVVACNWRGIVPGQERQLCERDHILVIQEILQDGGQLRHTVAGVRIFTPHEVPSPRRHIAPFRTPLIHHIGIDRDVRENFRGHAHFEACAEFCEKYDQAAFDPAYDSAPLEFFAPIVERVMARPINSMFRSLAD